MRSIYTDKKYDIEMQNIFNYISENYKKEINITSLSKEFHTNRNSLNIKFKRSTGLSVMEYVANLRINIAQSMIRQTTLPVSEIAYRVGYMNPNNFSRMFKKITGNSPSFYRNKT